MKVYVVLFVDDDYVGKITTIFDTEEKAEAFVENQKPNERENYDIEEWDVN